MLLSLSSMLVVVVRNGMMPLHQHVRILPLPGYEIFNLIQNYTVIIMNDVIS